MPAIKSSTDLRNNYNDISTFCHKHQEPVFITKNGQGDLAVMSIDLYEVLNGKLELYQQLAEGRAAINEGRKRPLDEAMQDLRKQAKERDDGQVQRVSL
ncbi:MAG: type II toxin-antitoxin system prevent-host-death family antitoxin [Oscillospiraceae bacterium]|nr:type II toxin-antitoxin system prevent-host-death family antitoxin [Oscillospiraceae bacterium]